MLCLCQSVVGLKLIKLDIVEERSELGGLIGNILFSLENLHINSYGSSDRSRFG